VRPVQRTGACWSGWDGYGGEAFQQMLDALKVHHVPAYAAKDFVGLRTAR
jgi:hypothetical protein